MRLVWIQSNRQISESSSWKKGDSCLSNHEIVKIRVEAKSEAVEMLPDRNPKSHGGVVRCRSHRQAEYQQGAGHVGTKGLASPSVAVPNLAP